MTTRPSFEMSQDVERLVGFLNDRQRASYSEMSALTGRHIDGADRYVLSSARRILEKRGRVFVVERGVGLTLATNGQVAKLATDVPIRKIQRTTSKAKKRQVHVNIQTLSADERLAFFIGRVVVNTIGQTTLKSFRTKIAQQIEQAGGEVDLVSVNQLVALPRHRRRR